MAGSLWIVLGFSLSLLGSGDDVMRAATKFYDGQDWHEIAIEEDQFALLQSQHDQMSKAILNKCIEEVKDPERRLALFEKRCPSFIEIINLKLEEKIAYRIKRPLNKNLEEGQRHISKLNQLWINCPICLQGKKKISIRKYFLDNKGKRWRWFCGTCKNYKIPMDLDEVLPEAYK